MQIATFSEFLAIFEISGAELRKNASKLFKTPEKYALGCPHAVNLAKISIAFECGINLAFTLCVFACTSKQHILISKRYEKTNISACW